MMNKYNSKFFVSLSRLLTSRVVSKFRIAFYSLMIFFPMFMSPSSLIASSVSNEELMVLLQFAVENNDDDFLKDVITSLLDTNRPGSYQILSAISKYNNAGKLDFAVHNAIKANDLVAAFILAFNCKNVNKSTENEVVWVTSNGNSKSGCNRDGKNLLELAFWHGMDPIMPYLIKRGADIYHMRLVGFTYEDEEDLSFVKSIFPDAAILKFNCLTTKKALTASSYRFRRNLIGDAIAMNRLDVIEMLGKNVVDWNQPCLRFDNGAAYSPLQYSLVMNRDDIALYLIMHGVSIE